MKKVSILLISLVLLLSSCFGGTDNTEEKAPDMENQVKENEIVKEEPVNEMTDTKTEEEAIEEFDKEVEEILKLLEDNG